MKNNRFRIQKITKEDYLFPIKMSRYDSSPQKLYYIGNINNNSKLKIAIIGTRKALQENIAITKEISSKLASNNITIISGLAIGIDSAAHKGALSVNGKTWAVMGHGLDIIYPQSNTRLAEKIIQSGGAIISEYKKGVPPYSFNFLNRNKIICAISDAIVLIQAPLKSGAISTATFALKLNIPVFVIPGPAKSYDFEGSNQIIRNGGKLITGWKDLFNDLKIKYKKINKNNEVDNISQKILKIIGKEGGSANIDNIIKNTTLNPHQTLSKLTEMEIDGTIEKIGDKYILK